jgi:hypothetical protein
MFCRSLCVIFGITGLTPSMSFFDILPDANNGDIFHNKETIFENLKKFLAFERSRKSLAMLEDVQYSRIDFSDHTRPVFCCL